MNAPKSDITPEYKSVLSAWDTKSSVRSTPRRMAEEKEEGQKFFSTSLVPMANHPLVVERGTIDEILVRQLYQYLDFTTILEQEIVNPVVLQLSRDSFGFNLPDQMKFDAFRIYCDEAYHALFSVDIKLQVAASTGTSFVQHARPRFAEAIENAKRQVPKHLADIVMLCAAVVSETLISGTLTRIPQDPNVIAAVRETMADHAMDERTHHAYFTKILEVTWPQLHRVEQELLSPYFADFILAFLEPDQSAQHKILLASGFDEVEGAQIVIESDSHDNILASVRLAARSTIKLLERTDVLSSSRAREYFIQRGLIQGG